MLVSLSTLLHGSLEEKLSWTFRLYDLNHDGSITKAEIAAVVVAVYELLGVECAELVSSTVLTGWSTNRNWCTWRESLLCNKDTAQSKENAL